MKKESKVLTPVEISDLIGAVVDQVEEDRRWGILTIIVKTTSGDRISIESSAESGETLIVGYIE